MKKITIYGKREQKIVRLDVSVYYNYLLSVLKNLDEYYGVETEIEEFYGTIPENSNNVFYECEIIEIIPTGNEVMTYKYTVKKINATRLSSIIRNILLEKPLKASYAIEELFNYNCRDEKEKQLWNEVKTCFNFKEKNRLVDLKKLFLQFSLGMEDDVNIKYTDDETATKIEKLPYVNVLTRKGE